MKCCSNLGSALCVTGQRSHCLNDTDKQMCILGLQRPHQGLHGSMGKDVAPEGLLGSHVGEDRRGKGHFPGTALLDLLHQRFLSLCLRDSTRETELGEREMRDRERENEREIEGKREERDL